MLRKDKVIVNYPERKIQQFLTILDTSYAILVEDIDG